MSTESFTNALLIVLISLIGTIGSVGIKKVNELIKDVRLLLLSDMSNKKDILHLQNEVSTHDNKINNIDMRIDVIEKGNQRIKY